MDVKPRRAPRACVFFALPLLLAALWACTQEPRATTPETPEARSSYAIGLHLGMRLAEMQAELDPDDIVAGFGDGLEKGIEASGELDAKQIQNELVRLSKDTRAHTNRTRGDAAQRRLQESAAFLAANRTRPGVVELPSGVQYRIVSDGGEAPAGIEDRITVEYEGRLLDGAIFDTSRDRFAPTIVRLQRTPAAWREVLTRVPVGASVEIWVPGDPRSSEHPVGLVAPGELVVFTLRVTAVDRHGIPVAAHEVP